eukprot:1712566-Amphidinium_carterae.1
MAAACIIPIIGRIRPECDFCADPSVEQAQHHRIKNEICHLWRVTGDVEVISDDVPEMGMGYVGTYRIRGLADGLERTVERSEIGGLMHLGK